MTHEPPTGWDASAHPGFERLAELDEGLLDSADAERVAEHAAGCAHCRDEQAQLNRTRTLLGSLPDEPLPADIAARLDAALADAASTQSTPAQATVLPLDAQRRRRRIPPAAAGLGAAAAIAAVVAILVVGHGSGGGHTGTPEQTSALGAAGADTVLSNLTTTESGTDYTSKNLDSTVPPLVGGPHLAMTQIAPQPNTGAGARPKAAALPAALAHLHDSPDALRSCILGVEAGGAIERPLAIDFARYQGAPALLVVLPGLSAGFVDAWFVGAACSEADAHLLGYKAIPSSVSSSAATPSPGG